MANDAVEVIFEIDKPGSAAAKLKTLDEMMARLGRTAKTIGIDIDKSLVGINDAPARKLAGSMDLVHVSAAKGAVHLGRVKEELMQLAKVPGIPALEGLNNLGGAGIGALFGGITIALTKINDIFVGIKEEQIELLHKQEKFANVGLLGMRGGTDQTREDFEKLRSVKAEVMKLTGLGMTKEASEVEQKMLGAVITMAELDKRLQMSTERATKLGIDTRDPAMLQKVKDMEELRKRGISDFNELNQLRLGDRLKDMDHADKLRKVAFDTQAEMAKLKEDSFQQELARAQKLGSLFDEAEKLRAGLGGADTRSKNASIDAEKINLAKQIQYAMLAGREFGPGGRRELLSRYETLGMTSPTERLGAESTERAIRLGQTKLASAGTDKLSQSFALDQILSATSNIGSLTSDQVDVRFKALQQKTSIDQDVKTAELAKSDARYAELQKILVGIKASLDARNEQGVKITLKDDSKGSLNAELGATPTPESSGALTSTPAFRNDPRSGRL